MTPLGPCPLHPPNASIVYVQGYFSQTSQAQRKQDTEVESHAGGGDGGDDGFKGFGKCMWWYQQVVIVHWVLHI